MQDNKYNSGKGMVIEDAFRQRLNQLLTNSGWGLAERHPSSMPASLSLQGTSWLEVPWTKMLLVQEKTPVFSGSQS